MSARPELAAVAGEILVRQLQEAGREPARPATVAAGMFTVFHVGPGLPFQALVWIAHDQRLLHWTFPAWDGDGPDQPWRRLLESFTAAASDEREWAIFGLRVRLPRALAPAELDARPGAVSAEFVRGDGLTVTARRLGLAELLLAERPMAAWLERTLRAARCEPGRIEESLRAGVREVRCGFTVRGERPLDRVAWRRWPGEARWWYRPDLNRICGLEVVGPPGAPRPELDHAWVG